MATYIVLILLALLLLFIASAVLRLIIGFQLLNWARWIPFQGGILTRFFRLHQTSLTGAVVRHLSAITQLNLPMARALTLAGKGESGRLGYVLRSMGAEVELGAPVTEALRRANPASPGLVLSVIAAGERAGQLPQALADLELMIDDRLQNDAAGLEHGVRYWIYPLVVVLTTMFIVGGVMIFIIPKFKDIFKDFDTELPPVTLHLIGVSAWFINGPGLAIVLVAFALIIAGIVIGRIVRATRNPDEPRESRLYALFRWIPGITQPVDFGNGMSAALRVLRMGMAAGMTLPMAARLAGSVRINRFLGLRWEQFSTMTDAGIPASTAAVDAKLGNVFAWACRNLERGQADPNLVFEHAADYHRAIARRWWRMLGQTLWPAVTCLLGCLVGYVALALFLPLVTLIDSVMGAIPC